MGPRGLTCCAQLTIRPKRAKERREWAVSGQQGRFGGD
jgi:hypothetical protein